jgi:23S rRNA (adenine2030-N6)-methyltransferase
LVLIDPSYELKSDFKDVLDALFKAHKRFASGTYVIWYPVVERYRITQMEKRLISSGIKDIQRFEAGVAQDAHGRGMTASGLFVVNPPWTLYRKMSALLPKLTRALSDNEGAFYKCDVLVPE